MQVKTQPFKEALELKGDGISFDVYGNGSKRLGDLCVTKAGLIWSKGQNARATRDGGINVKWEEFIDWVQSRRAAAGKTGGKLNAQAFASMKPQAMKAAGQGGQSGQGAKGMSGMRNAAAPKLAATGAAASRGTAPKLSSGAGSSRALAAKSPSSAKMPLASKAQGSSKSPVSKSSMSTPLATRALAGKSTSEAGKLAGKRASTMKAAASAVKAAAGKTAQTAKSAAQTSRQAQAPKLGSASMSRQAKPKMAAPLSRKPAMSAAGGSKTSNVARRKAN